jgi:kynurenine formamidase
MLSRSVSAVVFAERHDGPGGVPLKPCADQGGREAVHAGGPPERPKTHHAKKCQQSRERVRCLDEALVARIIVLHASGEQITMADLEVLIQSVASAQLVDLSQQLEEHMPHYPTHSKFHHVMWNSYWHGERSLTYQLMMNEHSGTHVDAPAHFISDTKPDAHVTMENVPLDRLIGRGVRIDSRQFRAGESVPLSFLGAWEQQHGELQPGDIVLFNFGWSTRWALRPQSEEYTANWPGLSMDVARYLLGKQVKAIGTDTLSPDNPEALGSRPIHAVVLEKQVLLIENLTNLDRLPDFFLFLALPLKIRAGSGSPIRAVALY